MSKSFLRSYRQYFLLHAVNYGRFVFCSVSLRFFWATVCERVHPMLSDRCLSVCPVCNIGVLWPNSWMDQDETWLAGRPLPWPHCVRWGPSAPSPNWAQPQFLAHICCGQMAGWIKILIGREGGLSPSDIVLDGDPAPPPQKRAEPSPNFRPMSIVAKRWMDQDGTWHGGGPRSRPHCARWRPSNPTHKGGRALLIFSPCLLWPNGWMHQDGTWHGGGPRSRPHCARWGSSSPLKKGGTTSLQRHW